MLRKALGGGWLRAEREDVGLDRDAMWFDVERFRELMAEGARHGHGADEVCPRCVPILEEAVSLHRGDFMEGFSLRDSEDFDDWQLRQAESLRRDRGLALERLVQALRPGSRKDEAIPHAETWLALDPLHEPAHRALMLLYAETGQRAAAVRQYRECVRILSSPSRRPPSCTAPSRRTACRRAHARRRVPRLRPLPASPAIPSWAGRRSSRPCNGATKRAA